MLNEALNLAKRDDETKIGISVQIPKSLKEDFEELCKNNNVSMASMLQALIKIAVNQSKGIDTQVVMGDSSKYKKELIDVQVEKISSSSVRKHLVCPNGEFETQEAQEAYENAQKQTQEAVKKLYELSGIK